MSYIVLALGVLLTAAGGASIYDGFDIIQLERGWTEVIAGATAIAGGIVTIALGLILRRLKILCDLYATAGQPLLAPSSVAVEPHMVAAPLAASPVIASSAVPPPSSVPPLPPAAAPIPAPAAPAKAGGLLDVPGVLRPAAPRPVPPPAKPFVRPAKPFYPEPEPARELAFASSSAALMEEPPMQPHAAPLDLAPLDLAPVDEAAIPERPRPSAAALSLDEMWKRVTEEIERPIWSPEPSAATSPAAEVEASIPAHATNHTATDHIAPAHMEPWEEPAEQPELALEPVAASKSSHLDEFAPIAEPESEPVEHVEEEAEAKAHAAEALLKEEAFLQEESFDFAETPRTEPVEAPAAEPHLHMPPPPVEPPAAEPAVIGRYEAEGTAYLMFDDGSIEAQSEAGVFRFASMAELKAFIEDRQAVEP